MNILRAISLEQVKLPGSQGLFWKQAMYSVYKSYFNAAWTLNKSQWVSVHYRCEYVRRSSDSRDVDTINQMGVWAGYKLNNFDWTLEGIYKKADKYNSQMEGKDNYEYNFRGGIQLVDGHRLLKCVMFQ